MLKVLLENIRDLGSRIGTYDNMCFYLALRYTLSWMGGFNIENDDLQFYLKCVQVAANQFPVPGVMVDTDNHSSAITRLANHLGVKIVIYPSVGATHKNYFSDTFVSFGDDSCDKIVKMLCCRNHYIAFNYEFDTIVSEVSKIDADKIIAECKAAEDTSQDERLAQELAASFACQTDEERKAKEEQERKAKEEGERERKAKEEQERKAKEEQERKAKEEQERKAKEELDAQKKEYEFWENQHKKEQERKFQEQQQDYYYALMFQEEESLKAQEMRDEEYARKLAKQLV